MDKKHFEGVKKLLDNKFETYHQASFITKDPVSVPHRFSKQQDIEIAAFFAAILAWGNRTMIINNCNRILQMMDHAPHDFILHHEEQDLKPLYAFAHRTFNGTDLLHCIAFFKQHFTTAQSLETAFMPQGKPPADVATALIHFHHSFFDIADAPERTRKHIASPAKKSACKRLNMFLRWMIRKDSPVDFGLWHFLSPAQLICPLDTHVSDVSRRLGLIHRKQNDWQTALELTYALQQFDPLDPVKYDYALFALGVEERF
ncbi:TIGR02757 family protein [Taibaiella sp. KBW10]|uniref:TIGR02757 family protein n=1 Tax=Taibaiella sp. KBW10 TaxID=2153357 RepID=UPI000F5AF95C|nr:TIGR02757 family protein [Taibaiella sp. KBW10]RQO29979.1 TIGR02757 family protein [Taibaiella sp. KBW10]